MGKGRKWKEWKGDQSLPTLPLNQVNQPGAYLDLHTGCLFRVPPEGLRVGNGSMILITSEAETMVCKLSDDPYIPKIKAKIIAADNNYWTNF
ncbi:hypothetical protein IIA15_03125 [candidate division TA06 bacterium]|nr:hypothetical protein [candidate division TA06 bacterium]